MHVKKDLSNLANKIALDYINADLGDFDMHNLFPPKTLFEHLEEEASGTYTSMPDKTLKEKYISQPLLIKPDYSGDFLEKLKEPYEGKSIEAASNENLWDFTMPSEMLKEQEKPFPRELVDEFYEFNSPGAPVNQVLKDYWDRAWDPNETPEMSEDKWERYGPLDSRYTPFRIANVLSTFLLETTPNTFIIDKENNRTAAMLTDFEKSLIKGKKPEIKGVSVRLSRAEPRMGRWVFKTSSGKDIYTTAFQFIPSKNITDTKKLHVRVSCTCPSWLFWGAQFNAYWGKYLYGPIRPKFSRPDIRDPHRRFLVCKHVLACIPVVSNYHLSGIAEAVRKKLVKEPPIRVEIGPEEKIRIPKDLRQIAQIPEIEEIENNWADLNPQQKKKFIMGLKTPDEVAYIAHRFPDATKFVVQKLTDMANKGDLKSVRAKELLQDFVEEPKKEPTTKTKKPSIPAKIKNFSRHPEIQKIIRTWEETSPANREKMIEELTAPGSIAYLAFKFPETAAELAIQRLTDMAKESVVPSIRQLAREYLRNIV